MVSTLLTSVIMMATISLDMNPAPWRAVNDGVMGGVSSGRVVQGEEGPRFEGELSLENNGGFSSVRRRVDEDLSGVTGVRLEVRGDGRTYQFRMRMDDRFDGVAWRAEFPAGDEWRTVEMDFAKFIPVFRGYRVKDAGPLVPAKIRQIGFLVADKQAGAFRLDIRSVEFLTAPQGQP